MRRGSMISDADVTALAPGFDAAIIGKLTGGTSTNGYLWGRAYRSEGNTQVRSGKARRWIESVAAGAVAIATAGA